MQTGSMLSLLLAVVWLFAAPSSGFCPHKCVCDDVSRSASCSAGAKLDVVPITLNPNIETLALAGNRIKTVDASMHFYTKLKKADFSNNQ